MRNSRRLATIGLSVLAAGALLAGTASAGTSGPVYKGTASAEALKINLFGQAITTSGATAELSSDPLATATATQLLTPATQVIKPGTATAKATTVGQTDSSPKADCKAGLPDLTQIPGVARADLVCGQATASLTPGGGSARGLGAQLVLEPSVSGVLSTIKLQDPAQQGSGSVRDALNPLVQALTGAPLAGDGITTVEDVLSKTLSLETTARIVIAPALAEVNVKDCVLTSHARAQAVRIELLPVAADVSTNGLLPAGMTAGEPLLVVTIADPDVIKSVPCNGGNVTTDAPDPKAPVATIHIGSEALLKTLGVASKDIAVAPGQSLCILQGTPLETCLAAAASSVDAAGNPHADGASVELFKGVNGGVTLVTGRAATAGSAAAPAAEPAAAEPAGALPRTGGNATLPIVGGALLALAFATRRLAFGRR